MPVFRNIKVILKFLISDVSKSDQCIPHQLADSFGQPEIADFSE